jgi:transposase
MKKSKQPRPTRAERAAARQALYEQDRKFWIEQGKKEAAEAFTEDLTVKRLDANIKLAHEIGQLIDAASRAIMTFIGEGGIR